MTPAAALAFAALLAAGAPARPPAETHVARLMCGGASFAIDSRTWPGADAPLAPAAQSLSITVAGRVRELALESGGSLRRDGRRVRRSYVLSWACVTATTGEAFVDLSYACAADPGEPGACAQGKEWFRLLDARGRHVDAAALGSHAAYDRLLTRLGLRDAMAAGVPMTDVLDGG